MTLQHRRHAELFHFAAAVVALGGDIHRCRRERLVPQQIAHDFQSDAALQRMRRKSVPQPVGRSLANPLGHVKLALRQRVGHVAKESF